MAPPRTCPRCSNIAPPAAKYCAKCGTELKGSPQEGDTRVPWRYISAHDRARTAVLVLILLLLTHAVAVWADMEQHQIIVSALGIGDAASPILQQRLLESAERLQQINVVQFLIGGLSFFYFCRWWYKAHRNLRILGRDPKYSQGWAVAYWFIPIVNLFRPYQVAKELWIQSTPDHETTKETPSKAWGLVRFWWAIFLALVFHTSYLRVELASLGDDSTWEEFLGLNLHVIFNDAGKILMVLLFICVVRGIDHRQEASARNTQV